MSKRSKGRKAKERRDRRKRQEQYQAQQALHVASPLAQPQPRQPQGDASRKAMPADPAFNPCELLAATSNEPCVIPEEVEWVRLANVPLYAFAFSDTTTRDANMALAVLRRLGAVFLVVCNRRSKLYEVVSTVSICGGGRGPCGADHREAAVRVLRRAYAGLLSGEMPSRNLLVLPGWVKATGLNLKHKARLAIKARAASAALASTIANPGEPSPIARDPNNLRDNT